MRLWHKDLIPVLPRKQLISQWRECCAIARNIAVNGTPNHLLVNKVMNYSKWHFYTYTTKVCRECEKRGYNINRARFFKWFNQWDDGTVQTDDLVAHDDLFADWHNERYLKQCYYNLQEKYDCGGITNEEWMKIVERVKGVDW